MRVRRNGGDNGHIQRDFRVVRADCVESRQFSLVRRTGVRNTLCIATDFFQDPSIRGCLQVPSPLHA